MTNARISLNRRHLLAGGAGALAAAGLGPWGAREVQAQQTQPASQAQALPPYAAWKDADSLIVHSANTLETRRDAYGTSVITPREQLFVRNNLPPPDASIVADPDAWEIMVEGVKSPRRLTVRELKSMGLDTVAMVLQCSGNGRAFFPSKPSGTQWTVGASGCVIWSGVPVRTVVEVLGGRVDGTRYMTGTGGEKLPEGIDPLGVVVERSVPLRGMEDALLAWELNGMPVPLANGGPLRLIVPGFQGVNNIKYIKRLAFTTDQTDARIMADSYRMAPPGTKGNPSQPSVWEMPVKSWVNHPLPEDRLQPGLVQIEGVAFSSHDPVKRVEVSVDGGKNWRDATLFGPDLGKYAWRQFVLPAQLPAGEHRIVSRATDAGGHVQPEERLDNVRGYNNNSWADHGVTVRVG